MSSRPAAPLACLALLMPLGMATLAHGDAYGLPPAQAANFVEVPGTARTLD